MAGLKPNDYYQTPPEIHLELAKWIGIDQYKTDPCSPVKLRDHNIKAEIYYGEAENGLDQSWGVQGDHVLLNMPYSQYEPWIYKAIHEAQRGVYVWALMNQSNSNFWQDVINQFMRFKIALRQRVKFYNAHTGIQETQPRYDNYIVHFGPDNKFRDKLLNDFDAFPIMGEVIFQTHLVGRC